jgi:SAM-dependent methyltransferase
MEGYEPSTYGNRIAGVYDELYGSMFDNEGCVQFLRSKAGGGRALELAVGTGRIALPLKESGVKVHGIDISEEMVTRMKQKPGAEDITVTIGDFADVGVQGDFELVYILFNTLFALMTQDDQVRCFRNVADHLTPDGTIVVEAFVPDLSRFVRHQTNSVVDVQIDQVQFDASRHDPVNQVIHSQHVFLKEGETKLYPVSLRYAFPAEMDLMARLAGLELKERWEDWRMRAFTSDSKNHISVYGFK